MPRHGFKALALTIAAGGLALLGAVGSAEAGPGYRPIDPGIGNGRPGWHHRPHWHRPHWQRSHWHRPHGHRPHWRGYGVVRYVPVALDDCYMVRRRVYVPGVGIVIKRRQICA